MRKLILASAAILSLSTALPAFAQDTNAATAAGATVGATTGGTIGFLLGGRDPSVRSVMGLGTAQRNVSAAILVSAQNFAGTMTLPFVLVAAILLLLVLLPTAKRMGARSQSTAARPASAD